jgi:hypothetical protein
MQPYRGRVIKPALLAALFALCAWWAFAASAADEARDAAASEVLKQWEYPGSAPDQRGSSPGLISAHYGVGASVETVFAFYAGKFNPSKPAEWKNGQEQVLVGAPPGAGPAPERFQMGRATANTGLFIQRLPGHTVTVQISRDSRLPGSSDILLAVSSH